MEDRSGIYIADRLDWDVSFIAKAILVALRSSDPSTKVGAVIVSKDNVVISEGYNGFPRGYEGTFEEWHDKVTKYSLVVHAEANAIYNAGRSGKSLKNSKIYLPWFPCSECAKAIVQAGIKEVHSLKVPTRQDWAQSFDLSRKIFDECGVAMFEYDLCNLKGEVQEVVLDLKIMFGGKLMKVRDLYA